MNYSVSQVNFFIKQILAREEILYNISIQGEISNFNWHKSGHMFFTLKDEASTLRCIVFKGDANRIEFFPKDGMEVSIRGDIRVYEKDGTYRLYGHKMEIGGRGLIKKEREELAKKLEKEGLFELNKKFSLPPYPTNIGVVTAFGSAALKDIINIIDRRYPLARIKVFGSLVQGENAAAQLCRAIKRASKHDIDVLIIGRGGGQAEDLSAFDQEEVVKEVANFKAPVISAVGHEKDTSLTDLAACVRASTPSAAAELCVPDLDELKRSLELIEKILYNNVTKNLMAKRQRYLYIAQSIENSSVLRKLSKNRILLQGYRKELDNKVMIKLKRRRLDIKSNINTLAALNPLNVLERGYAVVFKEEDVIVKSKSDVSEGGNVKIRLKDGRLNATINKIEEGQDG